MKKINLLPVTALVITAALSSSIVNAEDKVATTIAASQLEMAKVEQELSFSTLRAELDSDADGKLSQEEVAISSITLLQDEFNNIDANEDQHIEEIEFNSFLAEIKNDVTNFANSDR